MSLLHYRYWWMKCVRDAVVAVAVDVAAVTVDAPVAAAAAAAAAFFSASICRACRGAGGHRGANVALFSSTTYSTFTGHRPICVVIKQWRHVNRLLLIYLSRVDIETRRL